jgi:CheY-like chemotaxis protein
VVDSQFISWGRNPVLIALTGWGQDRDKQTARASGFDHHLTKPVDPAELENVLSSLLHRSADVTRGVDSARAQPAG